MYRTAGRSTAIEEQRFSRETAILLREAQKDLARQIAVAHWDFYQAFRVWMSRIIQVDAFFIGLFHAHDRILIAYHYDGNDLVNRPGSIKVVPGGPSSWVREHKRTYRFSFDDGAVLNHTIRFGDVTKVSADALVAPLVRAPSKTIEVFGVASIQTYSPGTYHDEQVAAFEWLTSVVARLLTREEEDRQTAEALSDPSALSPDAIIAAVVRDIGSMRGKIDDVLTGSHLTAEEYNSVLERLSAECARVQAETAELVLDAHRVFEARLHSLTKREQEVALLLAQGLSNAEIASQLGIVEQTVKLHVSKILQKYGVKQRSSVEDELRRYLG